MNTPAPAIREPLKIRFLMAKEAEPSPSPLKKVFHLALGRLLQSLCKNTGAEAVHAQAMMSQLCFCCMHALLKEQMGVQVGCFSLFSLFYLFLFFKQYS